MKKCKVCCIEKELDEFNPHHCAKDGKRVTCAVCQAAKAAKLKAVRQEKRNEYVRALRATPEHRQKEKEYKQSAATRERRSLRRSAGGKEKLYSDTVNGRASAMYNTALKGAVQRGLEFTLTLDWFKTELKKGECAVTGIPFVMDSAHSEFTVVSKGQLRNPFRPSVDRIDSTKGYSPDNCQLVITMHNQAKGAYDGKALKVYIRSLSGWAIT